MGENSNGPVVILGASYAKGLELPPIGDVRFVNKSVAGEQSFEMLNRFDADVAAESLAPSSSGGSSTTSPARRARTSLPAWPAFAPATRPSSNAAAGLGLSLCWPRK